MIIAALWLLEKEWQLVEMIAADDVDPWDKFVMKGVLAFSTSPIWVGVGISPYWTINQQAARLQWAVDDVTYTKQVRAKYGRLGAKFRTMTAWNYFPKHRTFAMRGGGRWFAAKAGARFIPYLGWALLAIDLWHLGKWIGERTTPNVDFGSR